MGEQVSRCKSCLFQSKHEIDYSPTSGFDSTLVFTLSEILLLVYLFFRFHSCFRCFLLLVYFHFKFHSYFHFARSTPGAWPSHSFFSPSLWLELRTLLSTMSLRSFGCVLDTISSMSSSLVYCAVTNTYIINQWILVVDPIFLGAVGCVHSATLRQEQDGWDHAHEEDSQGLYIDAISYIICL